jgi:hypothetical protein
MSRVMTGNRLWVDPECIKANEGGLMLPGRPRGRNFVPFFARYREQLLVTSSFALSRKLKGTAEQRARC